MVHCVSCGYPNAEGRVTCFKCSSPLTYVKPKKKVIDGLTFMPTVFTVLAAIVFIVTIVACFDLGDILTMVNKEAGLPPMPMFRMISLTFLLGFILSSYLYAIGRVLEWMAGVRENLNIITTTLQNDQADNTTKVEDGV